MNKFISQSLTFLCLMLVMINCTPDANIDRIDHSVDEAYYPLGQIGTYWEYQLDSLIFDNGGATQLSKTGYIRTEVVDLQTTSNGDSVFTLQLNRRSQLSESWIEDKLYRIEKNIAGEIYVIIDNLVFKEFSFPFSEGSHWESIFFDASELYEVVEGELLEKYANWDSTSVINRDTTLLVSGVTYEDVASLQEADSELLISYRNSKAYYAPHVGLIKRERSILDSQCVNIDPPCEFDPWEEKAEKGYIVTQTLLNYNIEY